MALIISDATNPAYDGNLSTVNGFYRTIGSNWSTTYVSGGNLRLDLARSQDITFSAAGNLKGVVLLLLGSQASYSTVIHCDRSVLVTLQEKLGACTMDITTERVTYVAHGLNDGDMVSFSSTGTLPTGVVAAKVYFVINKDANTFQLSLTAGGSAVLMSGANGTGHVLWPVVRSKTLTSTEIFNTTDNTCTQGLIPFEFASTYAVDTTASKWRFCAEQTGGTSNYWYIQLSTAGQPWVYAAWDDTQVSFANNDSLIVKDSVVVDQSATLKGVLGAGITTYSWALAFCRNTDPTVANVCNFVWQNPPAASYTLTINGVVAESSHSGIRIGSAANRIPYAQQAILDFIAPTVGTVTGIGTAKTYASDGATRVSMQFYGERPTIPKTTLAANILGTPGTATTSIASPCLVTKTVGASLLVADGDPLSFTTTGALPTGLLPNILYFARYVSDTTCHLYDTYAHAIDLGSTTGRIDTSGTQSGTHTLQYGILTTDDCSAVWQVGDYVTAGGVSTIGSTSFWVTRRSIVAISGNAIALSAGAGPCKAGHLVINLTNGYGIVIRGNDTVAASAGACVGLSNLVVDGVQFRSFNGFSTGYTTAPYWSHEDATARSKWLVTYCSTWSLSVASTRPLIATIAVPPDGFEISRNIASNYGQLITLSQHQYLVSGAGKSGVLLIDNNIQLGFPAAQGFSATTSSVMKFTLSNNIFEIGGSSFGFYLQGLGCTINNNKFWNLNSASVGAMNLYNLFNSVGSGNTFDNCAIAVLLNVGTTLSNVVTGSSFGAEIANTVDIEYLEGLLVGWEESSPVTLVKVATTNIASLAAGSKVAVTNENSVVNADKAFLPFGKITRTGFGLTDTKVWNGVAFDVAVAGQFGARIEPYDGVEPVVYEDNDGSTTVGDCNGLTVLVTARIQINSAAFYAGVHVNPTLRVTHSGGTVTSVVAIDSIGAQQLQVIFTPTTSQQNIKIELLAATDATGTDRYVYFGELLVVKPEGVVVDTTRLSSWSSALPLGSQRTFPAPTSIWDEPVNAHSVVGSFAVKVKKSLELGQFLALK